MQRLTYWRKAARAKFKPASRLWLGRQRVRYSERHVYVAIPSSISARSAPPCPPQRGRPTAPGWRLGGVMPGLIPVLGILLLGGASAFAQGREPAPDPLRPPSLFNAPLSEQLIEPRASEGVPQLGVAKLPETFSCKRAFLYRRRLIVCDSTLQKDAENLRPIIESVPQAVAQLDSYQRTRRSVRVLVVPGSLGFVSFLSALILGKRIQRLRPTLFWGGLALLGGSVITGVTILSSNESKLEEAVRLYNDAKPRDPIELKFSATFNL